MKTTFYTVNDKNLSLVGREVGRRCAVEVGDALRTMCVWCKNKGKEERLRPKPEGSRCRAPRKPGASALPHRCRRSPIKGRRSPTANRKPGKQGERTGHGRPRSSTYNRKQRAQQPWKNTRLENNEQYLYM